VNIGHSAQSGHTRLALPHVRTGISNLPKPLHFRLELWGTTWQPCRIALTQISRYPSVWMMGRTEFEKMVDIHHPNFLLAHLLDLSRTCRMSLAFALVRHRERRDSGRRERLDNVIIPTSPSFTPAQGKHISTALFACTADDSQFRWVRRLSTLIRVALCREHS